MRKPTLALTFLALSLPAFSPVQAAITTFIDDFAGFNNATGPLTVEDFEDPVGFRAGLDSGVIVPVPVTFNKTGTVLSLVPLVTSSFTDAATPESFGATSGVQSIQYNGKNNLVFDLPQPIDGFSIDITGAFSVSTPATYQVRLDDNSPPIDIASSSTNLPGDNLINFSLLSDTPFSRLTFRFSEGGFGDFLYLDTLRFGNASSSSLAGDFDNDGDVDADDIDLLLDNLGDPTFDLTGDAITDQTDIDELVTNILNTFRGDANLNGSVGTDDLAILAANFNQSPRGWATADFTGDGTVGTGDLAILAGNFGQGTPPLEAAAVPEPASLALLGLGGLLIHQRRRSR
ncbi:MAG: PEP-CTERM sorting domain-containing protein [Planctomycetota bacterium]